MKKASNIIITVAITLFAFFCTFILVPFTALYFEIKNPKEEKLTAQNNNSVKDESEYVYSDEESLKYVNNLYGEAELINSVYVTEPEPKRICTFRDVKHGFEYTLTSHKGFSDLFYPHAVTALDSDYNAKLTVDLEENIKPILEKEGIVLFYDDDPEKFVENKITAYSYRKDIIVTPYSLLDDNKRIIEAAVCNYDYNLWEHSHNVRFFQEDLSDTEEIEGTEDT